MAMVKSIGVNIAAFDASSDYTFTFKSSGGNQVVKNKITIKNNETNEIVYTNTIESYEYKQTVPANTLTNGKYYNYTFITYDKNDTESLESSPISFYCYTTPELNFTNIPNNNIIETSTFEFKFTYNQIEGELLEYLIVTLFDGNGNELSNSGQILGQEELPNNLSYTFSGLSDDTNYYIQINGITINNTKISTEKILFSVNYYYPELFNIVDVSNNCEEGSVHITNNTVLVEGEANPDPPEFIDDEKIVLDDNEDYLIFNKGYYIGNTFTLEAWLNPVLIGRNIKLWGDDENSYIEIKLAKEIPYNESDYKYYLQVRYISNGEEYIYKFSDYINLINNLSDMIFWVRKTNDNIWVKMVETSHTNNALSFNEQSNVLFNRITDLTMKSANIVNYGYLVWNEVSDLVYNQPTNMFWNETPVPWDEDTLLNKAPKREKKYEKYDLIKITNTELINGIYDHINVTKDITKEFNTELPTWDYNTIFDCNFNGNIFAGNTQLILEQIGSIKIKRRKVGEFNWITLYEFPINSYDDLTFSINDYFVPTGEEFEWAIVPVLTGNIEGAYVSNTAKSEFKDVFITDGYKSFKLYNGVSYSGNGIVKLFGTLQPYGSKYPVIVTNPNICYETLTVSGNLLGYDFDNEGKLNDSSIQKEVQEFNDFMNNGKSKIFKDWNGKILLGTLSSQLNYSYSYTGLRIPTVSFTLTEQGKYDNQNDLYENGLIEVVS